MYPLIILNILACYILLLSTKYMSFYVFRHKLKYMTKTKFDLTEVGDLSLYLSVLLIFAHPAVHTSTRHACTTHFLTCPETHKTPT